MKIKPESGGVTDVLKDSRRLAIFLLVACLFFAGRAAFLFIKGSTGDDPFVGSIGASGVFFVLYLAIFEYSRFRFDTVRREVYWHRRTLFSRQSGVVPFNQIEKVLADELVDHENVVTRRLSLKTKSAVIPFTRSYTGDPDGALIRGAAELNTLLGITATEATREVAEATDELITAGRTLDAMRLIRATRGISLSAAKRALERLRAGAGKPGDLDSPPAQSVSKKFPVDAATALARGRKMDAIRSVRRAQGVGLREAKDVVDAYLREHPDCQRRLAMANSERFRNVISLLLLVVALALFAYYSS